MRLLGLPDALRRFGLTVEVVPGWQKRGSDAFNPRVSVGHHTAGSSRGIRPSLGIVTYGRSDLPGPLCNTYTDRNGVAIVVAAGRANHAGQGGFRGVVGNSGAIGHEAEDEGDGIWTPAQLWAFPRVHAAHLWLMGQDESWYCSHRTWTPRKPDPAGIEDDDMRRQIRALRMANPAPQPEEDDVSGQDVWEHEIEKPGGSKQPAYAVVAAGANSAADASAKLDAVLALLGQDAAATARLEAAVSAGVQASGGNVDVDALARAIVVELGGTA